jgi:hypothetical protein
MSPRGRSGFSEVRFPGASVADNSMAASREIAARSPFELSHAVYHTGQIVYAVRQLQPESDWLTIAPGTSRSHRGPYLDVQ